MRYADYGANTAIIVAGNMNNIISETLRDFWVQDCSAATENILLKATELGLGAVWCGAYPDKKCSDSLRVALNAPENIELKETGALCDIAPTVLQLLGIEQPKEMTGHSLIK